MTRIEISILPPQRKDLKNLLNSFKDFELNGNLDEGFVNLIKYYSSFEGKYVLKNSHTGLLAIASKQKNKEEMKQETSNYTFRVLLPAEIDNFVWDRGVNRVEVEAIDSTYENPLRGVLERELTIPPNIYTHFLHGIHFDDLGMYGETVDDEASQEA